jgi:hypothetical protein
MGLIYATLGEHETAVEQFIAATRLDNYLAVASVPSSPPFLVPFSSSPTNSVTSNVGSRISCLVVMIAPPKILRTLCFIYGGISQCMQHRTIDHCFSFAHSNQ